MVAGFLLDRTMHVCPSCGYGTASLCARPMRGQSTTSGYVLAVREVEFRQPDIERSRSHRVEVDRFGVFD